MRLLLDTNVFLWAAADPDRLGRERSTVEDGRTTLLLSAVSSWEIAIKHALARLDLPGDLARFVPDRMRRLRIIPIPIDHGDALAAGALPPIHRDPFDRMLVAQARALDAPILTGDTTLARYDVDVRIVE